MPLRFPPGTRCRLYYDADFEVLAGHYIVSNGGSGYLVEESRRSKNGRRWNLQCVRCNPAEIPSDAVIHSLVWYSRKRRK